MSISPSTNCPRLLKIPLLLNSRWLPTPTISLPMSFCPCLKNTLLQYLSQICLAFQWLVCLSPLICTWKVVIQSHLPHYLSIDDQPIIGTKVSTPSFPGTFCFVVETKNWLHSATQQFYKMAYTEELLSFLFANRGYFLRIWWWVIYIHSLLNRAWKNDNTRAIVKLYESYFVYLH